MSLAPSADRLWNDSSSITSHTHNYRTPKAFTSPAHHHHTSPPTLKKNICLTSQQRPASAKKPKKQDFGWPPDELYLFIHVPVHLLEALPIHLGAADLRRPRRPKRTDVLLLMDMLHGRWNGDITTPQQQQLSTTNKNASNHLVCGTCGLI